MEKETYLGDGLYASFDGFMLTLRAPRDGGDHWVGLEPEVYLALTEFVKQAWRVPCVDKLCPLNQSPPATVKE